MPDLSNIKRPNTFLGNLKTKEDLVRDELLKSASPQDVEKYKWVEAEKIISAIDDDVEGASYQNYTFNQLSVPEEIPYETESEEDETNS